VMAKPPPDTNGHSLAGLLPRMDPPRSYL
jgi:hypothetical protein